MFRSGIGGTFVALFVLGPALIAADKKPALAAPPIERGGVVWKVKVLGDDGKTIEEGRFRAVDFKIYHDRKQIGTYQDITRSHSKVSINHGQHLKGKFDLKMIKVDPPTWEGELERTGGGKYKVVVEFIREGRQ